MLPGETMTGKIRMNFLPFWPLAAGLLILYSPVYWNASQVIWQTDEMAHGPIILMILVWLFWKAKDKIVQQKTVTSSIFGWVALFFGLLVYIFGRVFNVSSAEFGSHLFVIGGILAIFGGWRTVKACWFPLLYIIFLVPLPNTIVDSLTGPLKHWISVIVVDFLFGAGYPIARTGVTITVGQYQLLVADACSGMHSMFTLAAVGTLFMYLVKRVSLIHNGIMALSILPIAFAANIVRVIILVLITYHFGDAAGQGFLHGAAGMLLMLVAFLFFFFLDFALEKLRI